MRAPLLLLSLPLLAPTAGAQADAPPPNFEDHIAPILRENCLACHRGSRARNGLELRTVASILKGGSSGPAIVPGDAAGSLLYRTIAHTGEPFMPPDEDPLGDEVSELVAAWIDGGARATAADPGAAAPAEAPAKALPPPLPGGPAPMPEGLATQPAWWTERGGAVTALATSPGAPLAAVAGFRQVTLYGLPDAAVLGVLPFPEGQVNSLRFSPSGALLLAGGGHAADAGRAVGWDVRTGERVFEVGDEPDVVLDADVTADHALVALGGPDRVVRAYDTATGALAYEKDEHTDWVTAVAFSPDGVLLATGDRAGGLIVREALSGEEFHALPAVAGGVTALDWRADSMVLAVAGATGEVLLFEMENGRRIARWSAHDATLGLDYGRSGSITTCGRDGLVRAFDGAGKRQAQFGPVPAPAVCAAATHDGALLLVGDFEGRVHVFDLAGKAETAALAAHPPTDEERELAAAHAVATESADRLAQSANAHAEATASARAAGERLAPAAEEAARAAELAALARSQVTTSRDALAKAEEAARGFPEPLEARRAALAAAEAESRAAAETSAVTRLALDEALAEETAAEVQLARARGPAAIAAASERLAVSRRLLDGATALHQIAAAGAAQADVEVARRRASYEAWNEVAAPVLAAVNAARSASKEADTQAATRLASADSMAAAESAARDAFDAARAELAGLEDELDAARAAEAAARERLAAAEADWLLRSADLGTSGGEVRALDR